MNIVTGSIVRRFGITCSVVILVLAGLVPVKDHLVFAQTTGQKQNEEIFTFSHTQHQQLFYKAEIKDQISVDVRNAPLRDALGVIARETGLRLSYRGDLVSNKTVTLQEENISVSNALAALLNGTDLDYMFSQNGYLLITNASEANARVFASVEEQIQERITGTILDAETGESLPGVNIVLKGTTIGTASGLNGSFELVLPELQGTLVFSFIGYRTLEVAIDGRSSIDVLLLPEALLGDELVVIGYGAVRRVNVTGAVSTVRAQALENRPITNATQALQGVRGLYVNQAGGQPGNDAASIRIRGIGTIGGAGKLQPLVLVDGVEYSLNDINPNDIESISVLKDAASASIYGSRAANGVILITTKQGRPDRVEVSYSGYVGFQEATILPDPVDNSAVFMEWYNKAQVNQGSAPLYSQDLINEFRNNPTSLLYPNTNWMDVMFDQALIQEHTIRISGGNDQTQYNLSTGYLDQDGVLMGTAAKRYSVNLRVNTRITDRLSVDASVLGSKWDVLHPAQGIATQMNRLMRMVPVQPVGRMEDGRWPDSWILTPGQNSFENPMLRAEEMWRNETTNRILVSAAVRYSITDNLQYQLRGSVNNRDFLMEDWKPTIMLHNVRTGLPTRHAIFPFASNKTHRQEDSQQLTLFQTFEYSNQFGRDRHSVRALAGSSIETFESAFFQASVEGFPTMDLPELSIGTQNPAVTGTSNKDALISYFGRVQYSYLDRYLLEVNSRIDGSSRFAKNNRWGFFPSFSAGWRLSEEAFMKDVEWVDELKIRGSWGQIGNQEIGRFQFVNAVGLGFGYPLGGAFRGGSAVTQSRDPNLKWETTTIANVGIDVELLQGKLFGEIDVFRKRTDGILRAVTLPAQVGALAGPVTNVAVVDNTGYEIGIGHRNQIGTWFSYDISAHVTRVKNEVVDLKGEQILVASRITREGFPIDSWFVLQTDGLFQNQDEVNANPTITGRVGPGDIKYVDRNRDGVINGDDRYIAGNTFPDYTYGFNINMRYKNISLQTLWQGVQNIHVRPNFNMASPFNNGAGLTKDWITDSWTPDNPNARLPRISARNQYTAENFSNSDFWLEDASYLRLKNVQLSYRISSEFINQLGIRQLMVFANGQNLLTFSGVRHFDPERDILAEHITQYPSVKTVTMGINVNF